MSTATLDRRGPPAPAIPPEFADVDVVSDLYRFCIGSCPQHGLCAEFGVYRGKSLRAIRDCLDVNIPLYGFDSFEGLPEQWNGFGVGSFRTSIRPDLPNTHLVIGRFEDTVPSFAKANHQNVSFFHIDCDLYSSTMTVLMGFADRIVPGTVILFDEIFGYSGYEEHEYRAFCEFIDQTGKKFEAIARWDIYRAAIRIV